MQNPPQKTYTVQELFALKPEIAGQASTPTPVPVPNPHAGNVQALPKKIGFWDKNKWYFIIGGIVVVGGTAAWILHEQKQKNKKETKKN